MIEWQGNKTLEPSSQLPQTKITQFPTSSNWIRLKLVTNLYTFIATLRVHFLWTMIPLLVAKQTVVTKSIVSNKQRLSCL